MKTTRAHHAGFRQAALLAAGLLAMAGTLLGANAPAAAPAAATSSAVFVFTPPKEGEVLMPSMREKLLTQIKGFLDRTNPTLLAHLKDAPNPFFPKIAPPSEPAPSTASASTPSSTPATAQLSPEDKLQEVADQIKPSGALIAGQNRLIFFANGDTLAEGQAINVTFPGDNAPTAVLLQAVTSESFTLKLGDAAKSFPYVAKESASHPIPSTTTPPTKP